MKKHWAVVLPLLVIGCAGPEDKNGDGIADGVREPDSVTVVAPATPKGTVSGQVLDTRMMPLEGVSVRLTIGSATADKPFTTTTDAAGNFLLTGVPGGAQVLVTVSKEGYATLRTTATVPSSAGNVPLNDGNASVGVIALAETTSSVRFTLLTSSGQPAVGAQAYLEARPAGTIAFNGSTATATSSVVVSAKADALGVVTFANVPSPAELARIGGVGPAAGGYRLWVDPVDANADGIADSGGYSGTFDADGLLVSGGTRVLRLPDPRTDGGTGTTAFQLVATNVPSLNYVNLPSGDAGKAQMELQKRPMRNLVTPGQPIYLSFSHPLVKDSLLAVVTDELGRDRYDVTVTASATGDVYAVTPSAGQIREGQEHNLILRATSAYDGTVKTWKGYFISGDPRTPKPVQLSSAVIKDGTTGTAGTLEPGECVIVTLNQVVISTASVAPDATVLTDVSSPAFKPVSAAPPSSNPCLAETSTKFPIDTTNFNDATARFVFQYGSASASLPAINPTTTTAKVRFDFARFQTADPAAYWESAWGVPIASTTSSDTTLSR
jgi:hypothetical protein